VPPEEQRELRARFGHALWIQRVTASLTQAGLAGRAGLSERTIRALEAGAQRPSDATTAKLAAALCPYSDAVTVAVLDLQLQADAGRSLRPRNRRKPPRVSKQRAYEEARRQLAAARAAGKPDPVMAHAMALIEPLPADPWEGLRRSAVRL
jgi:DNA-binding XRE family transcriptional regulator